MRGRDLQPLAIILVWGLTIAVTVTASGQTPADSLGPGIPGSPPVSLPGLPGQPAAPAPPDTATARLAGPDSWPQPESVRLWPEKPLLGHSAALILDFPTEVVAFDADSLNLTGDWLVLDPTPNADLSLTGLPPSPGWRAVVPVRLYHLGPARVGWEDRPVSPVVEVVGRLADPSLTAPVRGPRGLGWYRMRLAMLGLVAVTVVLLAWRLARRYRGGAEGPRDRELAPPAYLETSVRLWQLARDDLPRRGEGRAFLDHLARILRGYLTARFGLAAAERTATELAADARRSGWPPERLAGFLRLIARADRDRYAPGSVPFDRCQDDLHRAIALIAAARVEPRYTPIDGRLREDGDAAWRRLDELATGHRSDPEGLAC